MMVMVGEKKETHAKNSSPLLVPSHGELKRAHSANAKGAHSDSPLEPPSDSKPKKPEVKPTPAAATQVPAAPAAPSATASGASPKKKKSLERVYIIPLRKAFDYTRTKRARRAISLILAFAQRHMKCPAVKMDTKVNELIWSHGIQKIPRKVKVRLEKVDELTTVYLG